MAKTKREIQKIQIRESFKKANVWVGLFVVAFLVVGGIAVFQNMTHKPANSEESVIVAENTKPIETKAEKKASEEEANAMPKVKTLANTSGVHYETVFNGDNFWKISKRVCGTGIYYESIKAYNGYGKHRALQPGDVVAVTCAF